MLLVKLCSSNPGPSIMADPRQLWMGNVPGGLSEAEVIATLGQYGVRPYKVVLRHRDGQQAGICVDRCMMTV